MNENKISKIGVLTSGGDSPGMNAAIRAVVRSSTFYGIQCIGIRSGFEGLIQNDMVELGPRSVRHIINRGGTFLKTARCKSFLTPEGRKKAWENYNKNNLDALVIIGGDGSFRGGAAFDEEYGVQFIGVPGTIDNDIFGTDFTIGYDTAINTVVEAVDKIRDSATSHDRVFFIEVMGRDAGFIALSSGIATGAQDIIIPEKDYDEEDLFRSLQNSDLAGKNSSIVIVSEGKGVNVFNLSEKTKERFPDYDIRVSVLGHIQRGGNPSCIDRILASRLGVAAVEGLLEGKSNVMVGIRSNRLKFTPLSETILQHNEINKELIRISKILTI